MIAVFKGGKLTYREHTEEELAEMAKMPHDEIAMESESENLTQEEITESLADIWTAICEIELFGSEGE